jgi:hypothetical protein
LFEVCALCGHRFLLIFIMMQALRDDFGYDTGLGITHLEACDIKSTARKLLLGLELDHGHGEIRKIEHVRMEILDRAGEEVKQWLLKIFPDIPPEQLKKMGGPSQDSLDAQLEAAREVLQHGDPFAVDRQLPCAACGDDGCTISGEAYSQSSGLTFFMAGFTCKDWSQRGVGMGCGGRSFAPFLIMIFEIRTRKPDAGWLECAEFQPDSMLVALLGDLFWMDSAILCPKQFGVPVRRRRKWPELITDLFFIYM